MPCHPITRQLILSARNILGIFFAQSNRICADDVDDLCVCASHHNTSRLFWLLLAYVFRINARCHLTCLTKYMENGPLRANFANAFRDKPSQCIRSFHSPQTESERLIFYILYIFIHFSVKLIYSDIMQITGTVCASFWLFDMFQFPEIKVVPCQELSQ